MLGPDKFVRSLGGVSVERGGLVDLLGDKGLSNAHWVSFGSKSGSVDKWTVVHEFAHAWDANFGWQLSIGLESFTGGRTDYPGLYTDLSAGFEGMAGQCQDDKRPGCNNYRYFYGGTPAAGSDRNFNNKEDFAESVAAYVYPIDAQGRVEQFKRGAYKDQLYYPDYRQTARWTYVDQLVKQG